MGISFVYEAHGEATSSFGLALPLTADVLPGDVLVARLHMSAQSPAFVAPAGWTLVRQQVTSDASTILATLIRRLTSVPANVGFTFGGNAAFAHNIGGAVLAYRGVDATTPVDADAQGVDIANFTTPSVGPLTTTVANTMVIGFLAGMGGGSTETPPAGYTERVDMAITYVVAELAAFDKAQAAAGSTGTLAPTWTPALSGIGRATYWHLLALRPAQPTVTAITPNSGATGGGGTVTIKGSLFTGASSVTFGGTAATNVTVVDDSTITCKVPAHAAGAVDVVVTATAGSVTFASGYTYNAPTITGLSSARGSIAGGDAVTINGTNFSAITGVTFGGTAATAVALVSSTAITCVVPAHAAGAADVVVTDASTTTATIAGGYTFLSVKDATVQLSAGGNNKADTATAWPGDLTWAEYGGATDLWGAALTPAIVNGNTFGVAIQATVGDGSSAEVDYAEMTTYYTVSGVMDRPSLLCALTVNTDGLTTNLDVYELPRGNLGIANDAFATRAVSDAVFKMSRIFHPSRAIVKLWRELEFWLELLPTTNVPGFQVWAAADEGSAIQLRDGNGNAATIKASGAHRVFFPPDTTATGHYVQLSLKVPAVSGPEQKMSAKVRDMVLRGVWQPISSERVECTLVLSGKELIGGNPQARTVRQQEADLIAAQAQKAPVPYVDIDGTEGYGVITDLKFRTVRFKEANESVRLATLTLWKLLYA